MRKRAHRTIGRWLRVAAFTSLVSGMLVVPSTAFAQLEVTGVIGGLVGGDLDNIVQGNFSVSGAFDNGPLYGARVGFIGGFVGVEGSFVYSPSGLSISLPNHPVGLDGRVYYLEGNALLIPIPGPVSPFFTIGGGWHRYTLKLNVASATTDELTIEKAGWNFGGGIKINVKSLTFRGEVRDHLTRIGPSDFNLADIAQQLGIDREATVHNIEISGGVGIRF